MVKNLKWHVKQRLKSMTRYGESKHKAKQTEGKFPKGIFSYKTFDNYYKMNLRFVEWCKINHGCETLDSCKEYAVDYLKVLEGEEQSVWSIKVMKAAIQKLYENEDFKLDYDPGKRTRSTIKNHRSETKNFNYKKHARLVEFARSTGLRRSELLAVRHSDIASDGTTVTVRSGKGGKYRVIDVLPAHQTFVSEFAAGDSEAYVSDKKDVPVRTPEHQFRRSFAQEVYHAYDRQAMRNASRALGHNRCDVIAISYLS